MTRLQRRDFLAMSAAAAVIAWPGSKAFAEERGLRSLTGKSFYYGCATSSGYLAADPAYAEAVRTEAGILVPEGELKRGAVQRIEGTLDFSGADKIMEFADRNGMRMRGHTLVWHASNPAWLVEKIGATRDKRLMTDYITAAVSRYRGKLHSWDVVNEAVDPSRGDMRRLDARSPWLNAFGPTYIEDAFHVAREADPDTPLFYCDGNTEMDVDWEDRRRQGVLALLADLKSKRVPVDGFAVQGHLKLSFNFNEKIYASYLDEIRKLGLKIIVSELDVADVGGPADPGKRDIAVADMTRRFLDVTLDSGAVSAVLTWGLSDRYSWLSKDPKYSWPDGQLARGLPLDAEMRRKPMWHAMADSFSRRFG